MELVIFSLFYNREKEVRISIESLLMAAPNNSKIILVDDGSTDNTLKELNHFITDSRVEVISQKNKGFSKTLSEIIPKTLLKSNFKYIAIHGSGDICNSDKFIKQLAYMEQNPEVVALGCGHKTLSAQSKKILQVSEGFIEATADYLYSSVPFTHGTVVYRTDAFLKAGGYSPVFKYCQDWELYFRLISLGRVIRYPEVMYTKYIFNDGASFKPSKKMDQFKYIQLIQSRRESKEYYEKQLIKLSEVDIDELFPDKEFIKKYSKAQKSLIIKGEFKLALEWCDIIYNCSKDKKQKLIKQLLILLIKFKFPNSIMPAMYKVAIKVKK